VPSARSAFGEHVVSPQRILVGLVTWGPQPFAPDDVRDIAFNQVDALYRSMSYGKVSLAGAVTPWLRAFGRRGRPCRNRSPAGVRQIRVS
jgi:hypothetical protein